MTTPLHHATRSGAALPSGLELAREVPAEARALFTHDALAFLADLERTFRARRRELLARRRTVQAALDAGWRPDFLAETASIRAADWKVAPLPPELADRRVEITGPVDRKMVINALNSPAQVFMADFEDSCSPTWENVTLGQRNLFDAVRGTIELVQAETGKRYRLEQRTAQLFVRPRGWHLAEKHVLVDGEPVSASLFDFALFAFHNAREQLARGATPAFYLPKLEGHLEARLWNDVFVHVQRALGLPVGTIKATVLIETILAAFEMDEILWELREHSAGLNCGRWDYIFSFIKRFRSDPAFVLPDRASVGMDRHFLASYSRLLIRTCHRRGAHAMGGMAAQIPIKGDDAANARALEKVHADKEREAKNGHDGTWVAHPGLIATARAAFDAVMPHANQLANLREDVAVSAKDLLRVPTGTITEAGLRQNLEVGVRYLAAWLCGNGCVPIHDLMEDAATAEISRTQVWQWVRHRATLEDGRVVDAALVRAVLEEELARIESEAGANAFADGRFARAAELFARLVLAEELEEFLTLAAYDHL